MSILISIQDFQLTHAGEQPMVVLHTSCVLEATDDLRALAALSDVKFTVANSVFYELQVLKFSPNMKLRVNADIILEIAANTGTERLLVETVLFKEYPHGAVGGFLSSYYEMAFKGRDEAVDFEVATTSIFKDILGYNAIHLGQTGSRSAPDVLLISDAEGYQAIIDNKAYSQYSITGDHHNRMVHNYIENAGSYSPSSYPIGFFTYIAGGFISTIDRQIQSEVNECHVPGSGITVGNMIKLVERHQENPYSHSALRNIFGLNRQILLSDL